MEDTINLLETTIDDFINKTLTLNIDWDTRPAPGKWSNKEIIGHLTDSAQINLQRFVRCTYESGFKLIYYQDEWVAAQHYNDAHIDDVLTLWQLLNRQIIRVLQNYPPERLQAQCDNSREGVSLHTVEFLAADYVKHLQHHLQQVRI
jgi:hypothetical protein